MLDYCVIEIKNIIDYARHIYIFRIHFLILLK